MANGVTPRPNYQGGDISIFPYLQGIGNVLIANQQRAQAQQQAEKERADKLYDEVQKLSTKVNPAGILAADYDDFMNIYQKDIKQNMIDAMMARQAGNTQEYTKKIAAANEGIANANYLIGRSKARSEEYLKFQQSFNPEDYSDETAPLLSKLIETPTSRLGVNDTLVGNPAFMRKINTSKVQGDIEGILKQLYDTSARLSGTKPTRTQGGSVLEFEESVDKDAFAQSLEYRFASDPAFKAFARENNLGDTPEEAAINITALYEQQGRFTRTEGRQFVRDRASSTSGGDTDSAAVGEIAYNIPVNIGGKQVTATRGVDLTTSNVVVPNRQAVDAETGQIVDLGQIKAQTGVRQGQITGILEIPDLGDPFGVGNNEVVEYQIQMPNPNYLSVEGMEPMGPRNYTKTYYIRKDLLPEGAQNIKAVRGAVNKFDSSRGSISQNNSVSSQLTDNTTAKPKLDW